MFNEDFDYPALLVNYQTLSEDGPKGNYICCRQSVFFADCSLLLGVRQWWPFIADEFQALADDFQNLADEFQDIADDFQNLADKFQDIADKFQDIADDFQNLADKFQDLADDFQDLADDILNFTDNFQNFLDDFKNFKTTDSQDTSGVLPTLVYDVFITTQYLGVSFEFMRIQIQDRNICHKEASDTYRDTFLGCQV